MRIAVLGAGGTQAGAMLAALAPTMDMGDVVAVDRRWPDRTLEAITALGAEVWTADIVEDFALLSESLAGCQLIVNMAGPFYALGTRPLDLAVATACDYLDICDDRDATAALLDRTNAAAASGTRAVIGMGSTPGMSNVLIRAALDGLPPAEARVTIHWTVDTMDMSPGVLEHMFHCFATALDGGQRTPSWAELACETVHFPEPVGAQEVVSLGHPEPLTIPTFTRARRVVNKGGISPDTHLRFAWRLARLQDQLSAPAPNALFELYDAFRDEAGEQTRAGSGLRIDVEVGDEGIRFVAGSTTSMEEATGLPAAAGVLLMLEDGGGLAPGVWAPECMRPQRVFDKLRLVSEGGGGLHAFRTSKSEVAEPIRIRDLLGV